MLPQLSYKASRTTACTNNTVATTSNALSVQVMDGLRRTTR
ncbi:hypothetical protein ACWEO1_39595 [Kitasatospora cineracea]